MRTLRRSFGIAVLSVTAASVFVAGLVSSQETDRSATQAQMRGIYGALVGAYAYSLDVQAFEAEKNREKIEAMLEALATNTEELEAHGGGLDPSFDYLRRSLSRDAHDALARFRARNYIGARFAISKLTENCFTCHSKLPSDRKFDLGAEFIEATDTHTLHPISLAELEVATRQFDKALDTYEGVIGSPKVSAADLTMHNVFENYIKISVGPADDPDRAAVTLESYAARQGVPDDLRGDVAAWLATLQAIDLAQYEGTELDAARAMIDDAVANTKSRADRSNLVEFVASITLIHRYLRSQPADDMHLAEAYYLLGVAESYVARSYWISETEFLLERSIRQAPGTDISRRAYEFLEDYAESEYRVSQARAVPDDLKLNLEELRALAGVDE